MFYFEEQEYDRANSRRILRLKSVSVLNDGSECPVIIRNISAGGLLFEADIVLETGQHIIIELPDIGNVPTQVVWNSDNLWGCSFDRELTAADLAAALLQGIPGNGYAEDDRPERAWQFSEQLGPRLRQLRHTAGLTLADVAVSLGVSKPTVWAWEKGKARPVAHRVKPLADLLGVTVEEIQGTAQRASPGRALEIKEFRNQIAQAFGTAPAAVRIMIEL